MLRVSDLSIVFGSREVVSDVSFELKPGEILGFVGESGSGKSVTSLALLGLLPPNARISKGSALFQTGNTSVDLVGISEVQQERIRGKSLAMIFQEPQTSLNPSMSCGSQLLEAVRLHTTAKGKQAKARCLELLTEMQLTDPEKIFRSYPHQLSGGQKQRVMIAMALAGNPKLLIADEPTTALDVTVQKGILQLLNEIRNKHNIGIIFISHDLAVISEIADRVMVMQQGRLVEYGSVSDILQNPKHPYTKQLIDFRDKLNRPSVKTAVNEDNKPIFTVKSAMVEYEKPGWFSEGFVALKNISFTLFKGETLGLVGESGSGKSTIGRTLLKLIDAKSGVIEYEGRALNTLSAKSLQSFRREVQLVFQDPYSSLNPRLTIGQTLMEPFLYHGLGKKSKALDAALQLLHTVNLPSDSLNRYPHEFSGGQRQRIVLVRALMLKPRVLVCDEILSALDVSTQSQMLDLLHQLKEQLELTYLFISHDLSIVRSICNRVIVLRNGCIEEEGVAEQVFNNPQSHYTRQLVDAIPGKNF